MRDISRGKIAVKGFSDGEMDFQLLRQLGSVAAQGASVGECLTIANQMASPSPEAWVRAFESLGEWQQQDAMARLEKDHVISARTQFLHACNSFRAAEYYSPCQDADHRRLGLKSEGAFAMAMSTMEMHFEKHQIPHKDILLPAYFISPANDGKARRTLMIISGFDGTLEEECIMRGFAGIERDYNIILVAGPGQMDVFRHYPETFFEAEYEVILKKVIDHFAFRQEILMDKLALMGISLGGYFATRAAVFESRIKALIANSPVLDLHAYLAAFTGMDPAILPEEEDFQLADIPGFSEEEFPAERRAQTEQLLIRFGNKSFKNTFQYLKSFIVEEEKLRQLDIPCLALLGAGEGGEPRRQFDHFCQLSRADHYEFTDFQGAGAHCQVGNISYANAVVYDWLDEL